MSRSYRYHTENCGTNYDTSFVCNSDKSGPIKIIDGHNNSVEVSYDALLRFVTDDMRVEMFSKLEDMEPEQVIKLYARF